VEEKKIYYRDEIGMMTENFYEMKKQLDKKYELLEEIATKDALTKIANRYLFFKLSAELCSKVEKTPYEDDDIKVNVTISIGVALYHHEEDIIQTIERADEALYRAKKGGRNRVEI